MRGEKIYEYDLDITGVTDYGVSLQSIMSGEQKIPPQGTRFERYVRGARKGPPVGATAGRRLCPNARGWPDRSRPSGDVSVLHEGEPILDLFENVRITTAAATYAWVNARQVWAVGTMNLATSKIHLEGFMQ